MSNSVIKTRRSYVPGAIPTSVLLQEGQVAVNVADKLLYIADNLGNIINLGGAGLTINLTGDVTGSGTASSIATALANSGVTAGTYTTVTVDAKGRVTGGTNNTTVVALTTTAAGQVLDTFDITQIRSAKYEMQIETSGSSVQVSELRIVHNGTNPFFVEYGVVYSDTILGLFDVSISGNTLSLLVTPVNTNTTFSFVRTTLNL